MHNYSPHYNENLNKAFSVGQYNLYIILVMHLTSYHENHLFDFNQESKYITFYYPYAQMISYLHQILLRFYQNNLYQITKNYRLDQIHFHIQKKKCLSGSTLLVNLTVANKEFSYLKSATCIYDFKFIS